MRASLLAAVLAAGCGSTRPVEVPPPYDDSGIVVTVMPRVHVDWPLGLETIRGTVENRTGRDVDLYLSLNLVDGNGEVVGHASTFVLGFGRGQKTRFEAWVAPGPATVMIPLLGKPPVYARVERGFVCDPFAAAGFAGFVMAVVSLFRAEDAD